MTSSSTPESRRARSTSPGNANRVLPTRHHAPELAPHPHVDSAYVFLAVGRAILARALFIVHSMATIIQTVRIEQNDSVWLFALISLLIIFEGSYTIIMRAGDERKWFCPSLLLYIVATAPPIWLLETKLCEWRRDLAREGKSAILIDGEDEELRLQLLEQLLLVTLIVGRWLLPKGDISREQLSQILLAYLAISSDIVEFFDVFKEKVVYGDEMVQRIVLAAWTLSLLQFPFVLTVSRARKMRVAITKAYEELIMPRRRAEFWHVCRDVDIWAIILANSLQDIPFLLVRLFLMLYKGLVTYTMIFFTCKNALIIFLQTYRAFIIVNDRYIHPRPPEIDIFDEPSHRPHRRHHQPRKNPNKKGARDSRRGRGSKDEERQHLFVESSPRRNSAGNGNVRRERRRRSRSGELRRKGLDTLEETAA